MKSILLISPYWKEPHRWMVSSVKLTTLWQRMGYRVIAVCMSSESKVIRYSETLTVHFRKDIYLKDPLNFGIAPGFGRTVLRLVREEKPDIIVVNKILFWSSWSIIPLRLRGYRVIALTDALVGMTWWPRGFIPKLIMAIGAWTMGWLTLLCAQRIVFFHPQPERFLRFLGISKKSQVIPTGIDHTQYTIHDARYSSGAATVTYVGRLESVKGVDDFLEAVVPLKKSHPQLLIRVVGWFEQGHRLVERFRGDVDFTGLRDDIPSILAETDIFVLPSYSEGLSNALMEAMASTCACVATDVGGNRFLIENGVSGFLFEPGDRAMLARHVERLIEDPAKRQSLGIAARRRIEKHFSWDVVTEMYARLFADFHGS